MSESPAELRPGFDPRLPSGVRAFVRSRESGLFLAALVVGVASGLVVVALSLSAQFLHERLFQLAPGVRISVAPIAQHWRIVAVCASAAVVLAVLGFFLNARMQGKLADVVEANALHGGRMSFLGSLYITVQTLVSNGFGLSVGLEAAYTQMCGAVAAALARALAARRSDFRLLVACGAAAAISGAFEAPLAGAFYSFETVLGAYSVVSLAPVAASALAASFVASRFIHHRPLAADTNFESFDVSVIGHAIAIALLCSFAGILLMRSVAGAQRLFAATRTPPFIHLLIGGAFVGLIGWTTPSALGAGHAALGASLAIGGAGALSTLALIFFFKCAAVTLSLGSGFRGGLFFASFFLGGLIGRMYSLAVWPYFPALDPHSAALALIGMSAFGTGIIGAPIAMTCFALEMSGSLNITLGALTACALTSLIVRETFGYSFATWRFHLRGEALRGPQDVGWVRELRVNRLMRKDVKIIAADRTIAAARIIAPVGSSSEVFIADEQGRYAGMASVSDLHTTAEAPDQTIATLGRFPQAYVTPQTTIRQALDLCEKYECDRLAVVEDEKSRAIVGQVTEAHLLRRYGVELERRNREQFER
ncbi:MAG: chloride channel protein [Hyphomicrobiales bacterium]|nr:chloride channel protein [Hyphomicrobiales bacterium]